MTLNDLKKRKNRTLKKKQINNAKKILNKKLPKRIQKNYKDLVILYYGKKYYNGILKSIINDPNCCLYQVGNLAWNGIEADLEDIKQNKKKYYTKYNNKKLTKSVKILSS